MACVRWMIVGVLAALTVGIAAPVAAQPGRAGSTGLRVDGFDVEQVARLAPGTQLVFSVFGTPGAAATVFIEGTRQGVALTEVEKGVYEGSYTIEAGDRIRSEGRVTATLWRNGEAARSVLEEPLLLGGVAPAAAVPPTAEAPLDAPAPTPARPRTGTAVPMTATPAPFAAALPAPFVAAVPAPLPAPIPWPAAGGASCVDCAFVESIRAVDVASGPEHLGAVAGGVAGAIFGDRIGRAHARHVTQFLGAIGGALLGHEIDRQAGRRTHYEVMLRLPTGAQQVQHYETVPPFRAGDTVRIGTSGVVRAARPS